MPLAEERAAAARSTPIMKSGGKCWPTWRRDPREGDLPAWARAAKRFADRSSISPDPGSERICHGQRRRYTPSSDSLLRSSLRSKHEMLPRCCREPQRAGEQRLASRRRVGSQVSPGELPRVQKMSITKWGWLHNIVATVGWDGWGRHVNRQGAWTCTARGGIKAPADSR